MPQQGPPFDTTTRFSTGVQRKLLHDPKARSLMPPFSQSPFGDFPPNQAGVTPLSPNSVLPASVQKCSAQPSGSALQRSIGSGAVVVHSAPSQPIRDTAAVAHRNGGMAVDGVAEAKGGDGLTTRPYLFAHGGGSGGFNGSPLRRAAPAQQKPPKAGVFAPQAIPPTEFRRHYQRGDLPVSVRHGSRGRSIHWRTDPALLDYHHYLPLFFDGLRELEEPFAFIAHQGALDLLQVGGGKILPTIPQLIIPLKTALNTRHPKIVCSTLLVMQKLVVSGELIGEALVPYYRQLLPVFNLLKHCNANIGDGIEYGQRRRENVGDLIQETLQLLERHGGEDAFINIKYMVPTYESCVLP